MDQLNYDSNEDDDFSVEDVEYEAGNYDDHDGDLPAVSDLEFIAANAADAFEFIDTGANMLEEAHEQNISSSGESDDDSEDDCDDDMAVDAGVVAEECSSDDSSDSEDEIVTEKQYQKKSKQISWLTEEEGDEATTGPLKTKNELEEEIEVVEVKQLEISDSSDLVCVGEVKYRIDHECVVVIQADYTTNALNEGSVLCNVDGKILGKIQEIFGPITTPFYTVRWKNPSAQSSGNAGNQGKKNNNKNNKKKGKGGNKESETGAIEAATLSVDPIVPDAVGIEIENDNSLEQKTAQDTLVTEESQVTTEAVVAAPTDKAVVAPKPAAGLEIAEVRALFPVGAKLYTVRSHCSFVLAAQLEKARAKGSDASNAYDEEPPEEEMEFSDDEKEMEAKLARKQAKKGQSATAGQASADATFGDAIPPGGRFGANKRNLQGGRPNATRPAGHSSAGTGAVSYPQHQQFPPQAMPQHGYYPQQPPGAPMPPQAYGAAPPAYGMNPVYMGAPFMPQQQQAFYGLAPMPYGMPYGAPTPVGYPMQQQYVSGMHAYPAQQPMYPPQPPTGHMMPPQQQQQQQYAPQPGFLPAAAFVSGAYNQQQSQQPQGQNQGQQQSPLPQYQYQPLSFNNSGNTKK